MNPRFVFLILFISLVAAQANATKSCGISDISVADQMGSAGGGVMFMLGFIASSLIFIMLWYFVYYRPAHPSTGGESMYDKMKHWKINPFHHQDPPAPQQSYYPQPLYSYPQGYVLVVQNQEMNTNLV